MSAILFLIFRKTYLPFHFLEYLPFQCYPKMKQSSIIICSTVRSPSYVLHCASFNSMQMSLEANIPHGLPKTIRKNNCCWDRYLHTLSKPSSLKTGPTRPAWRIDNLQDSLFQDHDECSISQCGALGVPRWNHMSAAATQPFMVLQTRDTCYSSFS